MAQDYQFVVSAMCIVIEDRFRYRTRVQDAPRHAWPVASLVTLVAHGAPMHEGSYKPNRSYSSHNNNTDLCTQIRRRGGSPTLPTNQDGAAMLCESK